MAMKRIAAMLLASVLLLSCVGCAQDGRKEPGAEKADLGLTAEVKPATDFTAKANAAVYDELDFDDKQEYEFATRGLIDAPETLELKDEDGTILWSQEAYAFLDDYEKAPDSVNPSLWENTKNNHAYGLFEVTDGIYQVRGYDMANLTVVKGDTGWIVFDTLMSVECSQAAMQLIEKNLGKFPVKAVIISHSHADHFGGIAGVMAKEDKADETLSIEDQLASGKIPVITPVGFTEHSVKENVYAGKGMGRRSNYQYGILLTPGVTGKLAQGIGMGQSTGTVSFMTPSYEIMQSGEKLTIDGVELEFQLTPGTEAPAEMNTWLPQYKALWMAENCTGTLHNLYTLRGAEVRDGAAWASYITEAISLYGKDAEVTFQSHNWPHWGNNVVNDYMVNTAAVYKFINDQTLTYINQGYTSDEISNMIELPEALNKIWYTRQYYGTVAHNAKAVYQKFMGWYDSNPVNLNPLMPSDSAKKWVEYLGDVDKVLQMAKADFDKGEYQWVAEVTNTIVFADPTNTDARLLCADALEQLGYQAESGPWRNETLWFLFYERRSRMKKLKNILLINWLYFSKELIEVGDVNFLTGKNGAGKSTVIDALQIVLLGETNARNFNQAANEKSQRTLDSYLRADMDENNPYSRRGKDFSTYIVCEFQDDAEGSSFVTGVMFDCRSDGSRRDFFFIYTGVIPRNCYIQQGEAMEITDLRRFLKENYSHVEFYDTQKEYRRNMLAKWNVHNEQALRMMKKAISFKPIVDIQKFITENICDIPEKPNIELMQQNIRDYKRHEKLAQRQEEKLAALKQIGRLYQEMNQTIERWCVQSFLVQWAEKELAQADIDRHELEKKSCAAELEKAEQKIIALGEEIAQKDTRSIVWFISWYSLPICFSAARNWRLPVFKVMFTKRKNGFLQVNSICKRSRQGCSGECRNWKRKSSANPKSS